MCRIFPDTHILVKAYFQQRRGLAIDGFLAPGQGFLMPTKAKATVKAKGRGRPSAAAARRATPTVLLSGGNPQIAKGDGNAPVQAYLSAMPGWKRDVGQRLDALISAQVGQVQKAVKWNSPFYGVPGQGWFLSFHVFARYVKVTFFRGTSLRPLPPGPSKVKDVRYLDIHEGELDDAREIQLKNWVKQAAALPGWVP
jgi:hypothetical protein